MEEIYIFDISSIKLYYNIDQRLNFGQNLGQSVTVNMFIEQAPRYSLSIAQIIPVIFQVKLRRNIPRNLEASPTPLLSSDTWNGVYLLTKILSQKSVEFIIRFWWVIIPFHLLLLISICLWLRIPYCLTSILLTCLSRTSLSLKLLTQAITM